MDYSFKRFSPALIEDFRYIYEATNNQKMDASLILKKFDTLPFGVDYVGFLAYSSTGEPAAYYGVFPVLMKSPTGNLLVAQSGDTMTHPSHRGKGLFKTLYYKTEELARELGILFFFGFPNKNSHPGFTKFGWSTPFLSNQYSILLKQSYFSRIFRKVLPGIFYASRQAGLNKLCISTGEFIKHKPAYHSTNYYIEREKPFLSYKSYSQNSFLKFENGYIWMKSEGDLFYIGDVFPHNFNRTEALLKEIKTKAQKLNFSKILFYVSSNSNYNEVLEKVFSKHEGVPLIIQRIDKNFVFDEKAIEYTSADFDTY